MRQLCHAHRSGERERSMKHTRQRDERNKTRSFRAAFAARDRAAATPGFAIQVLRDTDLGIATLIVEDEEGHYEPINYASSLAEGFEMAKDDLRLRMKNLEGDKDPGLCPYIYKLWARGLDGLQQVAATWNVSEL
jgi:hypothetical protein